MIPFFSRNDIDKRTNLEHINWNKLVGQGRAKAYGVPWTEEEARARASGISAEDIRGGVWKPGEVKIETQANVEINQEEITTSGTAEVKIELAAQVSKAKRGRKPKK